MINKLLQKYPIFDLIVPCWIIGSLLVILCQIPAPAMDALLSLNIALGVIILLTTFFISKPLEFSIFPTVLLATTLFRLVLNVATTRLILTRGAEDGVLAAGQVVKSFSAFVTGENLVVGIVIFAIFIVIQFVVITKGATRISEVAARFTLDAMPGRQMAIDADLAAGAINEEEARQRRSELTEQGDFFGSMDGASKFVRGDAIASIIITAINIVGGLFVGLVQDGMPLTKAITIYTSLTIGDGLVTQVPALLVALATGILVTRSTQSRNLPRLVLQQVFMRPVVLAIAGVFLSFLTLTGMPPIPLLVISGFCFGIAFFVHRQNEREKLAKAFENDTASAPTGTGADRIENYLTVDPLELEIGIGLLSLATPQQGGDLLERVRQIRQDVAASLGIVLPKVRIRDSFKLDEHQFQIKLGGESVYLGHLYPDRLLAVQTETTHRAIAGLRTTDPTGEVAIWIDPAQKEDAIAAGYSILESGGVIQGHLLEAIHRHASELLTRDATRHLLDELKAISPAAVEELIPNILKLADVQQVLQRLLSEGVSIRQLGIILEALGDGAGRTKSLIELTEFVRLRLARSISAQYRDEDGRIRAIFLSPRWEEKIDSATEATNYEVAVRLSPTETDQLLNQLNLQTTQMKRENREPVLVVNQSIRAAVASLVRTRLRNLSVLGTNEITHDTTIISEAVV